MQAGFWEMQRLGIWVFANFKSLHAVEKGARRFCVVGVFIDQWAGFAGAIPFLATGHTGMAADTGIKIDNQGQLSQLFIPGCRPDP